MDKTYLIVILVLAIPFGAGLLHSLGRKFGTGSELEKGITDITQDDPRVAPAMPPDDDRGAVS